MTPYLSKTSFRPYYGKKLFPLLTHVAAVNQLPALPNFLHQESHENPPIRPRPESSRCSYVSSFPFCSACSCLRVSFSPSSIRSFSSFNKHWHLETSHLDPCFYPLMKSMYSFFWNWIWMWKSSFRVLRLGSDLCSYDSNVCNSLLNHKNLLRPSTRQGMLRERRKTTPQYLYLIAPRSGPSG